MDITGARATVVEEFAVDGRFHREFLKALDIMFEEIGTKCACGCNEEIGPADAIESGVTYLRNCVKVKSWLGTRLTSTQALLVEAMKEFMLDRSKYNRYWVKKAKPVYYIRWNGKKLTETEVPSPNRSLWYCSSSPWTMRQIIRDAGFEEVSSEKAARQRCNNHYSVTITDGTEKTMKDLEGANELREAVASTRSALSDAEWKASKGAQELKNRSASIEQAIEAARDKIPMLLNLNTLTAPVIEAGA